MSESIRPKPESRFEWKTLATIGAATWLVTSQMTGCAAAGSEGEGEGEGEGAARANLLLQGEGGEGEGGEGGEGEGGEGGEGEAGEGEGVAGGEGEGASAGSVALATDDVAYLTQLGLIRGHLAVGYALYSEGLENLAETHMKHPRAEIYRQLVPAFEARGCAGFGEGLSALTNAVVSRESQAGVTAAYEALLADIRTCERVAALQDPQLAVKVIENLLRTAGVEYQIGVIDGEIDNLHEYQDAWGFTQIAGEWTRGAAFASSPKATAVAGQLQALIAELQPLWPSLNPAGSVDGTAAQLFGAAGQVQVIAFNLQR